MLRIGVCDNNVATRAERSDDPTQRQGDVRKRFLDVSRLACNWQMGLIIQVVSDCQSEMSLTAGR